MKIIKYTESNKQRINSFLKEIYKSDKSTINYYKFGDKAINTYFIEQDATIIALGSLWENSTHPDTNYIGLNAISNIEACFTQLYKLLVDGSIRSKRLQTGIRSDKNDYIEVYKNTLGFKNILTTFEFNVKADQLKDNYLESSIKCIPFNKFDDKDKLLNYLIESYVSQHPYTSTDTSDLNIWRDEYLGKNVIYENSFVALNDTHIKGVISIGKYEGEYYLAHVSFTGLDILSLLLHNLKESLVKSSINEITFELNSVNKYTKDLMSSLEGIELNSKQIWETYENRL